jgi:hypothetical protein
MAQNLYTKAANKDFKYLSEIMYLGMMVTKQTCGQEEIKSRINSRNFTAMQFRIFSSRLLKEVGNILCREKNRLWFLKRRVLKRIFVSQRDDLVEK